MLPAATVAVVSDPVVTVVVIVAGVAVAAVVDAVEVVRATRRNGSPSPSSVVS